MKESIRRWNPWWDRPEELREFIGTERSQLMQMMEELDIRLIKDIIGVRRCGKTVLMYQIISGLIKEGLEPGRICAG